ncbi:hypothetical protein [Sinomonas sp. ASV322]|uniref:hypothetical protein n=1 Tax=Sinomonas sp. ASV322 TaxID=3041920 RepID=UPI0027DEA531|nr:hypothetical protein [Sinomonas sp. ASV322]MDQ4502585.1 hypothetical protein [Sinomonas sp. ASV322]
MTKNFLVTVWDDTPENRAAAEAIGSTCEADLAALEDWFNYRWADFPYGILVTVGQDGNPNPHAVTLWSGTANSPQISVYGATVGNAAGSAAVRDELARMLFSAELAEVLMHASPNGWNPGNNAGEGLSRIAGAELHPLGYYRPAGASNNGPYSTAWLQLGYRTRDRQDAGAAGPRYDFITVSENSDTNVLSYGCAIQFLYYLHTQLHYTWRQIATSWGAHLCETFAQLTNRPSTTAFTEFSDVLNAHLPPGTSLSPTTDNVFPLSAAPPVVLVASYGKAIGHANPAQSLATLKPGVFCEESTYSYRVVDITAPVSIVARAPGAFAPRFRWSVNGVPVSGSGVTRQATVPVRVVNTAPGGSEPAKDGVPLTISYLITDLPDRSQVTITNLSFPGNIDGLDVTAVMTEAGAANLGSTSGTTSVAPRYRDYDMEARWYLDVAACNPKSLGEAVVHRDAMLGKLFALKNLPDPSPEQLVDLAHEAVRFLESSRDLVSAAANDQSVVAALLPPLSAALTRRDLDTVVGLEGRVFRVPEPAHAPEPRGAPD